MLNIKRLSTLLLSVGLGAIAYGQTGTTTPTLTVTSMASYGPIVAPDSIASAWGTNLAAASTGASGLPLLTSLGGVQVTITDSSGAKLNAPLYLASPTQINFLVPANTALGKATVTVASGTSIAQSVTTGTLLVSNVAPAIITADGTGKGVPAAQVFRVTAAGATSFEVPFKGGSTASTFTTNPINISTVGDKVYIILFGTGIRRHSLNPVKATVGGVSVPVLYAGPQSQFPGLDQINIGPLPASLVGKGNVDVIIYVDGVPTNTVQIGIQ